LRFTNCINTNNVQNRPEAMEPGPTDPPPSILNPSRAVTLLSPEYFTIFPSSRLVMLAVEPGPTDRPPSLLSPSLAVTLLSLAYFPIFPSNRLVMLAVLPPDMARGAGREVWSAVFESMHAVSVRGLWQYENSFIWLGNAATAVTR
jgi:hypothetical protein